VTTWISLAQAAHNHDLTHADTLLLAAAHNWRQNPTGNGYALNDVRASLRRSPDAAQPSRSFRVVETGRDE
jgi:hypothetical protein